MNKRVRKFLPDERITRVRNLTLLMTGLFLAGSVHLAHVVRKWPLAAQTVSLTNRLRRFLSNPRVEAATFYEPIARLLLARFAGTRVRLLLDVTQIGAAHRLLTASVAYQKRALPLAWSVHRGTSGVVSDEATLRLLKRVARLMPAATEVVVRGDSGFGHVPVMQWLIRKRWDFVSRLRGSYWVKPEAGPGCYVRDFKPDQGDTRFVGPVCFTEAHHLGGVHLLTHWAEGEDDPWYLMSSQPVSPQTLRLYGVRMWTEEFYGDLKGHGFNLEATQLGCQGRLERLVLGVCYAYVWLIALGSSVVKRGLRYVVDRRDRRDKSYFRIGWDYIEYRLRLGKPIPVRFEPYP